MQIFIAGNVPSSKNSKVATSKGVFHSKTVRGYLQQIGVKKYHKQEHENYRNRANQFEIAVRPLKEHLSHKEPPYAMGMHFIRDTHRKFDFINAVQIICDLLVAHGVIEDDNMDFLLPFPLKMDGQWYTVNKEKAGVIIELEKGEV